MEVTDVDNGVLYVTCYMFRGNRMARRLFISLTDPPVTHHLYLESNNKCSVNVGF